MALCITTVVLCVAGRVRPAQPRRLPQLASAASQSLLRLAANQAQPANAGASGIPAALGWHEIPGTKLSAVCVERPELRGAEGCAAVLADWNGGVADTKRNRLLFWGGGHAGYAGNEVYALDLNEAKLVQLTSPSLPPKICVTELANPPGPNSRHNYNGLAYIADLDQMFVFGGGAYRGSDLCQPNPEPEFVGYGGRLSDTWTLDLSSLRWQRRDPTNGKERPARDYPNLGEGVVSDYDPVTAKVYVGDTASWYRYDVKTNAYTLLNHYATFSYLMTGAIDPERRLFVLFGGGEARAFDLRRNELLNWDEATSGCDAIRNINYPGLAYDGIQKKFVAWAGGNTVYLFDPTSKKCTPVEFPGGPGKQQSSGTFGRFRYFPSLGVFALVNDWQQDAFVLRLTAAGARLPATGQ